MQTGAAMTIRALVLSGGGGRGAFHAGVYRYLMQAAKSGVDADHQGAWIPDVVIGTSIGAVNGAAITQGISAEDLERFWLGLREHHIQGLPPGMGWLARRVANLVLKPSIGTTLPVVDPAKAFSPQVSDSWPPLPIFPQWLAKRLIGQWNNLLDTSPLYDTLINTLQIDTAKIAASPITLIISATSVRTGESVFFSNRQIYHPRTGDMYVRDAITARRVIASCSIPLVYPWTKDEDGEIYWDGAVVTNTPFAPALDAVRDRPLDERMEAVVVMMTPWWETSDAGPGVGRLPQDFGEAMTFTLDWALLSSFRTELKLSRSFNKLNEADIAKGEPPRYRFVKDVIVAPEKFLDVTRIIDYDESASRTLIDQGYRAAEKAFQEHFAS
jgi:NTE family protein